MVLHVHEPKVEGFEDVFAKFLNPVEPVCVKSGLPQVHPLGSPAPDTPRGLFISVRQVEDEILYFWGVIQADELEQMRHSLGVVLTDEVFVLVGFEAVGIGLFQGFGDGYVGFKVLA